MLRYDDYDLQRAELPLNLEPDDLSLCYQHWVSVRRIWEHYRAKPALLTDVIAGHPARVHEFIERLEIDEDELKMLLIWSLTYHHLARLGMSTGELDQKNGALEDWNGEDDDIWLSRWRRVRTPSEGVRLTDHPKEITAAANWSAQTVDTSIPIKARTLRDMVAVVDTCFGYRIEDDDLTAADADGNISGVAINCTERHEVKGSRTIAVTGLTKPGTFVLMWHGAAVPPGSASHNH
jgi:hypothetical protein